VQSAKQRQAIEQVARDTVRRTEPAPTVQAALPRTSPERPGPQALIALHRLQVNAFNAFAHATIGAVERLWQMNLSAGRVAIDQGTRAARYFVHGSTLKSGNAQTRSETPADTPAQKQPAPLTPAAATMVAVATSPAASTPTRRTPARASSELPKPRPKRAVKPAQGTIRNKRKAR
jgi:hypothetical protein